MSLKKQLLFGFLYRSVKHLIMKNHLTPVQQWIIGVGAIFTRVNDLPTDRLGDRSPLHAWFYKKEIKKVLQETWSTTTREDLLKAIDWLYNEGQRYDCYHAEMQHLRSRGHISIVDKDFYLIWDYCRMIQLYRWGYILGWFERDFCWDRLLPVAKKVQLQYQSWEEIGAAYLRGREIWAGGRTSDMYRFEEATEWLKQNPNSPWRRVDWQLPLKKDW